MLDRLKNWFLKRGQDAAPPPPVARKSGARAAAAPRPQRSSAPRAAPAAVDRDDRVSTSIESLGPGKNVLIRNKLRREDTGTHETLKILDDSMVDTGEEAGIDPYNTGGFDRSRNWDKRFGK